MVNYRTSEASLNELIDDQSSLRSSCTHVVKVVEN